MSGSSEIDLRSVRVTSRPNGLVALTQRDNGAVVVTPRPPDELLRFLLENTGMPDYATLARESRGHLECLGLLCPERAMDATERICAAARDEKYAENAAVTRLSDICLTLGRGGMNVTGFDDATRASRFFDAKEYDAALATVRDHGDNFVALEAAASYINCTDREVSTDMAIARAAFKYAELGFNDYVDAKKACGKARGTTVYRTRALALKGQLERILGALRQARDPTSAA